MRVHSSHVTSVQSSLPDQTFSPVVKTSHFVTFLHSGIFLMCFIGFIFGSHTFVVKSLSAITVTLYSNGTISMSHLT